MLGEPNSPGIELGCGQRVGSGLDERGRVGEKVLQGFFYGSQDRVSGSIALARPRRIKASHRRRRKVASGQSVQRYYDPAIGRFLSVDPVGPLSNPINHFGRYHYAFNNPYRFTDPDGRNPLLKLGVDFAIETGIQYATTGTVNVGTAAKETLKGALNPAKTLERAKTLGTLLRKVPNPHGRLGGPAHQGKVKDVAADVESRGLKPAQEFKVDTPGGDKGARHVDVAGIDPKSGKAVEFHQVGKSKVDGGPVAREQRAINDVQTARPEVPVKYHPYDKP